MFFHYLKIALRNLMKYKLQMLVSIVALAVGVVTLAATHFVLKYMREPAILDEPYAKECYIVHLTNKQNEVKVDGSIVAHPVQIRHEYNDALMANGGLAPVEKLIPTANFMMNSEFEYTFPDSTKKIKSCDYLMGDPEYLNFRAIRSAITGEKIPVLKKGEIVMPEYEAKQIFGDKNPIGTQVWISSLNGGLEYDQTFTIRDVYKADRIHDAIYGNKIFVPFDKEAKYYRYNLSTIGVTYELQLRKGYTIEKFIEEANNRLEQFGVDVWAASMEINYEYLSYIPTTRTVVYIISSLVLFASLVGFLKMQLQLFNMRRREVILRTVHGATKRSLFALFFTEVTIVLALSLATAFFIAAWLTEYIQRYLSEILEEFGWIIEGVEWHLLTIMAVVAVVCVVAVWIALWRITNMRKGAAMGLHRSAGHRVRNTMLGLQLIVGLLFLGGTFVLVQLVSYVNEKMNIPENDDYYKRCLLVDTYDFKNVEQFTEYLNSVESGVESHFNYDESYYELPVLKGNEYITEKLGGIEYVKTKIFNNEKFIDFWKLSVNYTRPELKGESYILINEELYELLNEGGVATETLHFTYMPPYPVAGTYKSFPYDDVPYDAVLVSDDKIRSMMAIVPKEGEYANVVDNLSNEIMRLNPTLVSPNIYNLRKKVASEVHIFENMERGAWILSFVSLVICIMGIYSSISLDTRSRLKEVAVRKVHGAKRCDIALLFGRLYLWLFGVAAVVTIPLIIIFCGIAEDSFDNMLPSGAHLTPYAAIACSFAITLVVVVAIVGYHIHKVMRLNPSDIIAKE